MRSTPSPLVLLAALAALALAAAVTFDDFDVKPKDEYLSREEYNL